VKCDRDPSLYVPTGTPHSTGRAAPPTATI